jgi:Ca-activated chloride channel family protein
MKPHSRVARSMHTSVCMILIVVGALSCRTSLQPNTLTQGTAPPRTVAGSVVDTGGGALPGVTVSLTIENRSLTQVTDAGGHFQFLGVLPGKYTLTAELSGFNRVTRSVRVSDISNALLAIPMKLSGISEAITVTAEAPLNPDPGTFIVNGAQETQIISGSPSFEYSTKAGGDAAASGESYARFNESDFTETAKHAISTFSIDVDTASYSIVRRILAGGQLPQRDAVRVEEMVNYFTYSYPEPENGAPFSVTTEVAGAPWNPAHRLLRIGIRGTSLAPWQTKPCNLVFLIDTSGSMSIPRSLPLLKKAFRLLVEQLRAEDRVAIVSYAGAAGLVLPSTSGAEKDRILEAIEALDSGGSTAGGAGIELAYKIAKENFIPDAVNRVILATDGDFNVGVSDEVGLENLITEKRKEDIELSVIGVGEGNVQDAKMKLLADKGNGNYAYVDDLLEARKVFVQQIGGTLVTIAKDVKLQLELDPRQVASFRQIGYESRQLDDRDFADDTKDAGELGSGHTVTALYELVPAPGASSGPIAKLQLRFKKPHGLASDVLAVDIRDEGRSAFEASTDLKFASAVAEFAMLLRDSKNKGASTWDDALRLAGQGRGEDVNGYRGEFVNLLTKAKELSGTNVATVSVAR